MNTRLALIGFISLIPFAAAPAASAGNVVTRDNFIRAETDRMFSDFLKLTGGVNRFHHIRKPTPLDQQTVVRMNRDTLYSAAIIDTSEGGTITLPPSPDGRYVSMHLIDNDHYDLGVIYEPGVHPLPAGKGHVAAIVRIQVFNPNDAKEIALVNAWQDKLAVDAKGAKPFAPETWDKASMDALRAELEAGARKFANFEQAMMPRGQADPEQRLYAAAAVGACCPALPPRIFSYPAATRSPSAAARPIRCRRMALSGRLPSTMTRVSWPMRTRC